MFSNPSFQAVVARLIQALGLASERALATELGLKSSAYYNRKKSGSLPLQEIVTLCLSRNVSIDWLFTGHGEALTNGEKLDVVPFSEVDPQLLAIVIMELERALSAREADARAKAEHAAQLGILAAGIYNKVSFERNDKLRRLAIKEEAEGFAHAALLLQQKPSLDED